uniref:Uncharacterized protein n=1 Tax=Cacopsylla melanoneura TaxID=428564 RepID=A0A8D8VHZ3_9HEMI
MAASSITTKSSDTGFYHAVLIIGDVTADTILTISNTRAVVLNTIDDVTADTILTISNARADKLNTIDDVTAGKSYGGGAAGESNSVRSGYWWRVDGSNDDEARLRGRGRGGLGGYHR